VDILQPNSTLIGKYRIERRIRRSSDKSIWAATDLDRGARVELSVYELDGGKLVVVDVNRPRLELIGFDEEDEPIDLPMSGPKRLWPWSIAVLACIASGFFVWHTMHARTPPAAVATSMATIQHAVIVAPTASIPPPPTPPPPTASAAVAPKKHVAPVLVQPKRVPAYDPLTL